MANDSAIMATMTGAELRKLREAADWTQAQAAALCEVSWRTYARWEEGLGKRRKGKAKKQPRVEPVPLHSVALHYVKGILEAAAAQRK
jgi:DNA-binding XRE family transcriptional regulator